MVQSLGFALRNFLPDDGSFYLQFGVLTPHRGVFYRQEEFACGCDLPLPSNYVKLGILILATRVFVKVSYGNGSQD